MRERKSNEGSSQEERNNNTNTNPEPGRRQRRRPGPERLAPGRAEGQLTFLALSMALARSSRIGAHLSYE